MYGWISYTLSRAERIATARGSPYDFDRTHLLNLVAGLPLPPQLGPRRARSSTRAASRRPRPPATTPRAPTATSASTSAIDKRAVWQSWLLDFYVDVTNVALLPEEVTPGPTIRYVLPTVGLRGRF